MKNRLFIFIFFFSISNLSAQIEDAWVYFKDKPSKTSYFENPLNMLSQRALDRRTRYNIVLDIKDVPIESTYITTIANTFGITVLAKSKWLNAIHIQGEKLNIDALLNLELEGFVFIDSIEFANKSLNSSKLNNISKRVSKVKNKQLETTTDFAYGTAENQLVMLRGETLHKNNFTGLGMHIAVIDAGFPKVDTLLAFKRIRDNGQILGGYDFVDRTSYFYGGNSHGTSVLSTMAGYLENGVGGAITNFVGTAPDASYYLFRTENSSVEVRLEESLWVEAAEKADSLGVDIINTSLGYSVFFDNPDHNYDYSAMDGKTTFITRGAEIAFSRGMLLVTSAGNEGNDTSWPYINAPADAPSILTVGAVNASGTIASFSSFGPTSDDRIKPDVCAQGQATSIINTSGNVVTGNGTSYSSPVLAGVVACLWQAFPEKTNAEITQLIKESAHLYPNATKQEGYGIPNFSTIFESSYDFDGDGVMNDLDICPNTPEGAEVNSQGCLVLPADNFKIEAISETCPGAANGQLKIISETSYNYLVTVNGANYSFTDENTIELTNLPVGLYEACIILEEQNYKQCYNITIEESATISGKVVVASKTAIVEIDKGTAPFTVYLNGKETMETLDTNFELEIKQGDLIEVRSSKTCEGVFSKEIEAINLLSIYPNPVTNIVNFNFPEDLNELNSFIYTVFGSTILESNIVKSNPTMVISHLPKGIYFLQVNYNNEVKIFKIIKD